MRWFVADQNNKTIMPIVTAFAVRGRCPPMRATGSPVSSIASTLRAYALGKKFLPSSTLETGKVAPCISNSTGDRASQNFIGKASATRLLLLQFEADAAGAHRGVHLGEPKFLFAGDADFGTNLHQFGAVVSPATP
jgi:hypothetical protein